MKRKFLIFSPPYKENAGGTIVLHKLCSILNDLGYESYLYPHYKTHELTRNNANKIIYKFLKARVKSSYTSFKTNPAFNTPVYKGSDKNFGDDWIVIYPEVVFGNPLGACNVVRWLLHNPGFHSGNIFYGANELYFKFNTAISDFSFPGSTTSTEPLKVIHYPLEHYNLLELPAERHGTAYCLRKGKYKTIQHDLDSSTLIDGKSHSETAKILKGVKTFISYDTLTAYSTFAVLCGCESVVIPDDGVTKEQWYPNPADRYGLSYGFSGIEEAKKTAHLAKDYVLKEEKASEDNVKRFVSEIECFFNKQKK